MKRSHRLLRTVHRLRKDRLPIAANRSFYEPYAEIKAFDVLMRDLHGDGYLDRDVMYEPTLALVELVTARLHAERGPDGLFARVGRSMARVAFAPRLGADGRYRLGGSERYVAEGCGTLAEAAILDRVAQAMGEVMRQQALIDHREGPCYPESYRRRFAQEEEERLGRLAP